MSPEQTQRWQEYGRDRVHFPQSDVAHEYALASIRMHAPSRQAFYVAMTAYRKELAGKQVEGK